MPRERGDTVRRALQTWLVGLDESTRCAYLRTLDEFRLWMKERDIPAAASKLRRMKWGEANMTLEGFRGYLHKSRKLTAGTVNTRLSALRSMLRAFRRHGLVEWTPDVSFLRVEPYRDTRGPAWEIVEAMIAAAEKRQDVKGCRDLAVLRLLCDVALRRGEVCELDYADVDCLSNRLMIRGKKRDSKEPIALPSQTWDALSAWLGARGYSGGPLFFSLARNAPRGRLGGNDVYRIVRELGRAAGAPKVTPHGLRHAAITRGLEVSGGNIRAVQVYARHASPATTTIYDDNRRDLALGIAEIVANDARILGT